jgi:hypothetical protein
MTAQVHRILAELSDLNPEAVLFDNMDVALIGVGYIADKEPVAVYSRAKMYAKLLSDGFSREDADEYYAGKFVAVRAGDLTPVIVDDLQEE